MRFTKYSKWSPEDWDDLNLQDLMDALSEFLLESGFNEQMKRNMRRWQRGWDDFDDPNDFKPNDAMQALRDAIRDALKNSGLLDQEQYNQLFDYEGNPLNDQLEKLIDKLVQQLIDEGYLKIQAEDGVEMGEDGDGETDRAKFRNQQQQGELEDYKNVRIKFEVTEKGLDFLGYKTLKHLMGSLGKASFGRHDTKYLSTGVEAHESSKQYEFGDTMNLDVTATLVNAIGREGLGVPLNLEYKDLMVHQSEYQSSCATVVMLDCSHSMILYGEDRFTPAKRVALALSHLIRTQYPGDSLKLLLFHDSAEEVPLAKLGSVQVGPYHTNTCEGLRLARRILMGQRKDMKQIIMITDGKPSALFVEGDAFSLSRKKGESEGRKLYKNSMGLDPVIIDATLAEAAACRKSGIMINTFMLTDDYYLVEFVKKLTEIAQGKAYFTTTNKLGEYVMMDFMNGKTRRVR